MQINSWQKKVNNIQQKELEKKTKLTIKQGSRRMIKMFDFRSKDVHRNILRLPSSPRPRLA